VYSSSTSKRHNTLTRVLYLIALLGSCDVASTSISPAEAVRSQSYASAATQLESKHEDVRCAAAKAISWARSPELASIQVHVLSLKECDWKTRIEAAWRLYELNHTSALDDVHTLLTDDDRRIRWNAAHLLGSWTQRLSTSLLDACASKDTDMVVREWCAWASCQIAATHRAAKAVCTRPIMELFRRDQSVSKGE